jgi:hypothetical protein
VINAAKELQPSDTTEVRELEVVQIGEKNKGGRPTKLTEARFARILQLIREGHVNTAACRIERIDYSTWRDHINQKPDWRSRLAEAEKIRDEVWRDHALEMVKTAMPRNWQAAMTYLERKYPSEFSLRNIVRTESGEQAHYQGLTREQVVALLEASRTVEAEAPRGFNQQAQLEERSES